MCVCVCLLQREVTPDSATFLEGEVGSTPRVGGYLKRWTQIQREMMKEELQKDAILTDCLAQLATQIQFTNFKKDFR